MKYYCELCEYTTKNKKDYTKHTLTMKHKRKVKAQEKEKLIQEKSKKKTKLNYVSVNNSANGRSIFICNNCNKQYNYKKSFSAHIVKCNNMDESVKKNVSNRIHKNTEILKLLLDSENNEIYEKFTDPEIKNNIFHNTTNNTTNNTYNNTINNTQKVNINVFLNTECKDAMNLKEFIDKMNLTIDDLLYTKKNGYIKGITNIFVKNLEDMQPKERPIHCTDVQTENFYIKDKDKWEHDNKHLKLNETIDKVTRKQISKIKDWEKKHPYWDLTDEGTVDYMNMIKNIMGGTNANEIYMNKQLIKKELSETFEIENATDSQLISDNNTEINNTENNNTESNNTESNNTEINNTEINNGNEVSCIEQTKTQDIQQENTNENK